LVTGLYRVAAGLAIKSQ